MSQATKAVPGVIGEGASLAMKGMSEMKTMKGHERDEGHAAHESDAEHERLPACLGGGEEPLPLARVRVGVRARGSGLECQG